MENKRCYNCKFWATVDTGYSNYTVCETTVYCLKNHFPETEESYSWRMFDDLENGGEFVRQAEMCENYKKKEGVQICFDVEGKITMEDFIKDPEVYNAAIEYGKPFTWRV